MVYYYSASIYYTFSVRSLVHLFSIQKGAIFESKHYCPDFDDRPILGFYGLAGKAEGKAAVKRFATIFTIIITLTGLALLGLVIWRYPSQVATAVATLAVVGMFVVGYVVGSVHTRHLIRTGALLATPAQREAGRVEAQGLGVVRDVLRAVRHEPQQLPQPEAASDWLRLPPLVDFEVVDGSSGAEVSKRTLTKQEYETLLSFVVGAKTKDLEGCVSRYTDEAVGRVFAACDKIKWAIRDYRRSQMSDEQIQAEIDDNFFDEEYD